MPEDFDFTTVHDRLSRSAVKWEKYRGRDVIPLWIADMDFPVAPAIRDALSKHVAHGDYGYTAVPRELPGLLVADYRRRYGWEVDPASIVWLPGLVLGINLAVKTCCAGKEQAITFSPIYPPFLGAPAQQGRGLIDLPLKPCNDAETRFELDFAALEQAASDAAAAGQPARLLLLCHPHNPIGRLFTRDELEALAAFCERHQLYVCSDEVHCELILDGNTPHLPFARVAGECSPALLARTITLGSPSKTYNTAGIGMAWAIVPDAALRRRFRAAMQRLVPEPCCFGYTALQAVLEHGEPWRQALLAQLRTNRDLTLAALDHMGLQHSCPEVTYLVWIDARGLASRVGNAASFFEQHGVGLSDGADFGRPGFLRLNFALPPALLDQALARMTRALAGA